MPTKSVETIEPTYYNSRNAVLVGAHVSKEFDVTSGVLQDDKFAHFLFIIMIDYVMEHIQSDHAHEKHEYSSITNMH